jgi:hypothetical protein
MPISLPLYGLRKGIVDIGAKSVKGYASFLVGLVLAISAPAQTTLISHLDTFCTHSHGEADRHFIALRYGDLSSSGGYVFATILASSSGLYSKMLLNPFFVIFLSLSLVVNLLTPCR